MSWFSFIACLTVSLTACTRFESADNELDKYVGRPVTEVAAKLGPPTAKFGLPDGCSSFDWETYGACTYSVVATTRHPNSP
jgi:hypothetical protein